MFSCNKLHCTKYEFKRTIDVVHSMYRKNSESMSIYGDTNWILKCSAMVFIPYRFGLRLSIEMEKEAKITAETKVSFLTGAKYVETATVIFEPQNTVWSMVREIYKYIDKDDSLTFICEIELMEPILNPSFQEDPLPACSFIEDFESMLSSGNYTDAIVECSDKELKAHRAVLAARCPVFAAMFRPDTQNPHYCRTVVPDVGSKSMAALLHYIYTGGIPSMVSELAETLVVANRCQLPRLKKACERDLLTKITVQNAISVLVTAEKHNLNNLRQYLLRYIKANIYQIIETEGWADLVHNCPDAVAELSSVGNTDGMEAFLGGPVPPCSLMEDFEEMLSSGNFADVIIECSNKELKAHRAVLAARCPVFAAMFSHDMMESQSGRIVVPDIGSEGMAALLKYIYNGGIPSMISELAETLVAANKYQLPRLKIACERDLVTRITAQNAIPTLIAAEKHNLTSIKHYLVQYIKANTQEIFENGGWVDLVRNCLDATAEYSPVRNTVHVKDPDEARWKRLHHAPSSSDPYDAKKRRLRRRNT